MMKLTPVEILMLYYVRNGIPTSRDSYPGYWNYQYNVDPHEILERLHAKSLIIKTTDIKQNLNSSTVKMLKPILKEHGLKVSGTKKELINRILKNIPENELKGLFDTEYYKMTEQAAMILKANEHIPYIHRRQSLGMSIYQAHEIKLQRPELSSQDIAWQFLCTEKHKSCKCSKLGALSQC